MTAAKANGQDAPWRWISGLVFRHLTTARGDMARPFAERLPSRPDSSDYFDSSRATAARFPAPPTVRVGSENIMSDRQQCGTSRYSDARPAPASCPCSPATLVHAALGRGDLRETLMGKACREPSHGYCFLALLDSYLTQYPLSVFQNGRGKLPE